MTEQINDTFEKKLFRYKWRDLYPVGCGVKYISFVVFAKDLGTARLLLLNKYKIYSDNYKKIIEMYKKDIYENYTTSEIRFYNTYKFLEELDFSPDDETFFSHVHQNPSKFINLIQNTSPTISVVKIVDAMFNDNCGQYSRVLQNQMNDEKIL